MALAMLAPVHAQGTTAAPTVEFMCRAGVPFRWRLEGSSWQETRSNRECLPAFSADGLACVYDIEVDASAGWFHRWRFSREGLRAVEYLSSGYAFEPIVALDTTRVCFVLALPVVAAGLYIVAQVRRGRRLRHELVEAQERLTESEARTGLFPVDGSTPSRIDGYDVVGKLGMGGMAVVYHVRREGQDYAMKLPLPNVLDDDDFRARFTREGRVGITLHHPNVVHVHDVNDGVGAFGYPYIVMDLVNGVSLKERMRLTVMTADAILRLGGQVLDALALMHAKGIIHRDIKPANLMVTASGNAKLMDFGIAYAEGMASKRLTSTGEMLGTPAYLAPEQITLEHLSADPRIDVYGVGMMLYEAIAGRLPWSANDTVAAVLEKVSKDPTDLGKVCPGLDPAVVEVIMRMIARDPEARYSTAAEARDALRATLQA